MTERRNNSTNRSEFDDLETRSLTESAKQEDIRQGYRMRQVIAFFILTFGAVIMIFREDGTVFSKNITPTEIEMKQVSKRTMSHLKQRLEEERGNIDEVLKRQYGKYRSIAFGENALKEQIVSPSSVSKDRLKRRMKIKIIQAALSPYLSGDVITFTWAVGGHSAAAGHGNLLNQSYAAVLERVAQPSFAALGIEFKGKNYAMGGTSSGPEVAMCLSEIFGVDIDVLSWDFGMTDGKKFWLYRLWSQRAGVHPTKPSLVSFSEKNKRFDDPLESAGMAMFNIDYKGMAKFPDSEEGDPLKLPSGIKFLMCDGHAEKGDLCDDHKWKTDQFCGWVGYQTSWHTGWKVHQYIGTLLASFLVENLHDALNELEPYHDMKGNTTHENEDAAEGVKPSISESYLNYLLFLEEEDKNTFRRSEIPPGRSPIFDNTNVELYNALHRNHSVCHTALMPSQARYDGLVTESGVVSAYLNHGRTTYKDEGYEWNELPHPSSVNASSPVLLTYQRKSREICEYAEIDFKDCFMVPKSDNWMSMLVPNNSEKQVFSPDRDHISTLGIIMICTRLFDWGKYSEDFIFLHELNSSSSKGSILVNGVEVTGFNDLDGDGQHCYTLKHEGGDYFPPSPSGQFDIKFRHGVDGGRIYISSVVIL